MLFYVSQSHTNLLVLFIKKVVRVWPTVVLCTDCSGCRRFENISVLIFRAKKNYNLRNQHCKNVLEKLKTWTIVRRKNIRSLEASKKINQPFKCMNVLLTKNKLIHIQSIINIETNWICDRRIYYYHAYSIIRYISIIMHIVTNMRNAFVQKRTPVGENIWSY